MDNPLEDCRVDAGAGPMRAALRGRANRAGAKVRGALER